MEVSGLHGIVLLTSTNQVQALAEQMLQEGIHKIDYAKRIHSIDVVGEARQAIETGANIIIARGYQAALIKDFTNVPIVEIRMTGQEMALLICQAVHMLNKKQPRLAVVGFSNMLCPIDNYGEIFDVRLSIYAISTYEEIGAVMDQLVREGVDLVIGIEEILESAAKLGIPSVLLATTKDSLQVAFDTAEQLLHAGNMEKENYAQIVSLLDYSFNGIIRTTPYP